MTRKKTDYRGGVFSPEKKTEYVGRIFNPDSPFKLACVFLLIFGILCLPVTHLAADAIKFATLAPKGSTWMNNFEAMGKEIRTKTDSELQLRIYPNGVQGDELDVIRKMRAGLLHAGAMTATGLGEIQKEVLIFQLPRLFKTYEELDYVRDFLREDLDKAFLDAGYVLIGMGTSASTISLAMNRSVRLLTFSPQASRCGHGQAIKSDSNSTKMPRSRLSPEKLHKSWLRSIQDRLTP